MNSGWKYIIDHIYMAGGLVVYWLVDGILLNFFQKISDFSAAHFGRDNFSLARGVNFVMTALMPSVWVLAMGGINPVIDFIKIIFEAIIGLVLNYIIIYLIETLIYPSNRTSGAIVKDIRGEIFLTMYRSFPFVALAIVISSPASLKISGTGNFIVGLYYIINNLIIAYFVSCSRPLCSNMSPIKQLVKMLKNIIPAKVIPVKVH